MHRYFVLVLVAVFLSGCGPAYLTMNDVSGIKNGMTKKEVIDYFGESRKYIETPFKHNSESYVACTYNLVTGSTEMMNMVCGAYGCLPVMTTVPVFSPYSFIFSDKTSELIAWGFIEELSKSPRQEISQLMPIMKPLWQEQRLAQTDPNRILDEINDR